MFLNNFKWTVVCLFTLLTLTLTACREVPSEKNNFQEDENRIESENQEIVIASKDLLLPEMGALVQETAKSLVKNQIEVFTVAGLVDAVQNAPENGEIFLQPGNYQLEKPIILNRNVTIRSISSEKVTVECATDLCVFMIRGGAPKLKNLTIISRGKSEYDNAVFVENGTLEMNGCMLISDYGYGIHVCTKNARAKVDSCVVKSCGCCGIRAASNASGEFTDCEISNNPTGVLVADFAELKFKNCNIHDNPRLGIAIGMNGHGHFQNCVISRTEGVNVFVINEGEATLLQCHISDGQKGGVVVDKGGKGTFHDNTLENNVFEEHERNWSIHPTAGHVTGSNNNPSLKRWFVPASENE